jgi:glycosyltransferase involved in cell wall biosynthesis
MKQKNNFFISIGRLEYQKGHDLLIEIYSRFKHKTNCDEWKIYIVGEGSQRSKLESQIKNLNLTDDIFLIGATTDVKKYYTQSQIYLMTSRWEGMPLVLDEALFFNLPVIAFDCETGPREMITDGVNGFLVPLKDLDAFVEKMILLTTNYELFYQLKQNCKLTLDQRSDRAILQKWKNLFNQLGGNH